MEKRKLLGEWVWVFIWKGSGTGLRNKVTNLSFPASYHFTVQWAALTAFSVGHIFTYQVIFRSSVDLQTATKKSLWGSVKHLHLLLKWLSWLFCYFSISFHADKMTWKSSHLLEHKLFILHITDEIKIFPYLDPLKIIPPSFPNLCYIQLRKNRCGRTRHR